MDDLLIKYILEEATPEESEQVQQWVAAETAHRAHFEKLQAVWQLAAQPNLQQATGTLQALQRLKQALRVREAAPVKRSWPRVWTVAAGVAGIAGIALGAYVWMKPKATIKQPPPVVQPATGPQQPVQIDTALTEPPTRALPADTIPIVPPHKKKRTAPVQPVHGKNKAAQQPTKLMDTTRIKKKHPVPAQYVHPVRKHKSAPLHTAPQMPPIS